MLNLAKIPTHMFQRWSTFCLVAALALAVCCSNAPAQSGAGSIQGTVTDATGAVIRGAKIQAVNKATGVVANTKSNDVGFYQVPGLFTGIYDVTVTTQGMKTYERSVELLVDQIAVINPLMTPGMVTQRVEVNADTTQLVDKENGTLGATLDRGRIDQIPMNGRVLTTLTNMTIPGVETNGASNTTNTAQRVDGLMYEGLEYVADGVPLNNLQFGGQGNSYSAILPDPDSVQAVEVETSNTSAAYVTPATAVITTKSGTNQLHGSLFETARNNAMGLAKQRQNLYNAPAAELIRNEFGASVGGPIVLPHVYHGKDKSFFFFAYERFSLVTAATQTGLTVPTAAERNGDFSAMVNGTGTLQTIYDPSTTAPSSTCVNNIGAISNNNWCRTQFAYNGKPNTINPALIDPETRILMAMSPQPTSLADPLQGSNLTVPNQTVQITPTITFRLDHVFNEKNKAFVRYSQSYQKDSNLYAGNFETLAAGPFPAGASGLSVNSDNNFAAALGYTHIFSPRFFAETNISQQWFNQFSGGAGPHTAWSTTLGLPNPYNTPGFPAIGGMNASAFTGNENQYQQNSIDSRIEENLTKILGKHQLQFGGLYRHERIFYLPSQQPQGPSFTSQTTGLQNPATDTGSTGYSAFTNTGIADADYFLGGATSYKAYLEPIGASYRIQTIGGYIQDDWHAKRNLTLNIGLRYEAHPGQKATGNITMAPDLKNAAIVLGDSIQDIIAKGRTTQAIINAMQNVGAVFETPAQAGFPSNLFKNDYAIFLPRLGFAWQPFGDEHGSVIRGAYGKYSYQMADRSENPTPTSAPFTEVFQQNFASSAQSPDALPNYNLRAPQNTSTSWALGSPGTPVLGVNTSNVIGLNLGSPGVTGAGILPGIGIGGVDPDYKPDLVTEANFTVEQALKGNSVVRIGWVFTHGTNLDQGYRVNYPLSTFGWEMNTGTPPPNGAVGSGCQYSATALGPWNCSVYGDFYYYDKSGWSNYNGLQANYQRMLHHGLAYQVMYTWSRTFRLGGNSTRDGATWNANGYATGGLAQVVPYTSGIVTPYPALPSRPMGTASYAQWRALDKFEAYILDTAIPQQHLQFNWIYDLPVGRGKWLLGNANRLADEVVGGWQFAGDGQVVSQDFGVGSGNWGATNPITVYKHNKPQITDCRTGVCHPEYLWFNGYISPKQISGPGGTCTTNCVSGLPTNYVPYEAPINNDPTQPAEFGNNNVQMSSPAILAANKGVPQGNVAYAPFNGATAQGGANPFSKTYLRGPVNYISDLSLYKVFPIREKVNFRMNLDVFNAFNIQGYNNPNGTDGTEAIQPGVTGGGSSFWSDNGTSNGRQVQVTARLTF